MTDLKITTVSNALCQTIFVDKKRRAVELVSDLLDIELPREVRKSLSWLTHYGYYNAVSMKGGVPIPINLNHGVMVLSLDGHGGLIYYTRHATGTDEFIDPMIPFKPYQPKGRVVIVENYKGMGPSTITVLEQKPVRENIHDWLNENHTPIPNVNRFLEEIQEHITLSGTTDDKYIALITKREQQQIDYRLGKGWTIDVKLFDTDVEGTVAVVTTARKK